MVKQPGLFLEHADAYADLAVPRLVCWRSCSPRSLSQPCCLPCWVWGWSVWQPCSLRRCRFEPCSSCGCCELCRFAVDRAAVGCQLRVAGAADASRRHLLHAVRAGGAKAGHAEHAGQKSMNHAANPAPGRRDPAGQIQQDKPPSTAAHGTDGGSHWAIPIFTYRVLGERLSCPTQQQPRHGVAVAATPSRWLPTHRRRTSNAIG